MSFKEEVQIENICKEDAINECVLFVNYAIDGFAIALYKEKNKEFLFAETKNFPIKDFKNTSSLWKNYVEENPILKSPFKYVKITLESSYFSLIPSELYAEENKKEDLSFLVNVPDNYKLMTENVNSINAVAVYAVPQFAYDEWMKNYPQAKFTHSIVTLLKATETLYKNVLNGKKLFVDIHPEFVNVLCYNSGKLQLANSYPFENENDITYQLVNIMKQFDMDTMRDHLFLSGGIEENSAVYQKLAKYIKNILFVNRPDIFNYTSFFDEIPPQQYFVLLSSAL